MNALTPRALAYDDSAERAYPARWFERPVLALDCEDPAHLIARIDAEAFIRMANLRAEQEEGSIQAWQRTYPQHPLDPSADAEFSDVGRSPRVPPGGGAILAAIVTGLAVAWLVFGGA